jgi:GTPase Era involved in 16S rRNA processing
LIRETGIYGNSYTLLEELKNKTEKTELVISVFGQFKRGKSTLINNIIKENILPVGVIPVTSVVTQIKYGKLGAQVFLQGQGAVSITAEDLKEYIDESRNSGNEKKVEKVVITMESDFLKGGLTLVDTPGVGSLHKNNSKVAYNYIRESDAVIFLLSVDSPINEIERDFLKHTRQYADKIFFAVNKADYVTAVELKEYISYCENLLQDVMEAENIRLFPMSAKNKDDKGVSALVEAVSREIFSHYYEILGRSVDIKFSRLTEELISKTKLQLSAINMPLKELEITLKELKENLRNMMKMSDEASYLMEQKTDVLMNNIGDTLADDKAGITKRISDLLRQLYEENKKLSPGKLNDLFEANIKKELTEEMEQLDSKYLKVLETSFREITKGFNRRLEEIFAYLSERIKILFGVEFAFDTRDYQLSEAKDNYIRILPFCTTLFPDTGNLILLLPKSIANPKIFRKAQELAESSISKNTTNIVSDYHYKIRESKRSFNTHFRKQIQKVYDDFEGFTDRIMKERNMQYSDVQDEIMRYERILAELEKKQD